MTKNPSNLTTLVPAQGARTGLMSLLDDEDGPGTGAGGGGAACVSTRTPARSPANGAATAAVHSVWVFTCTRAAAGGVATSIVWPEFTTLTVQVILEGKCRPA